MVRALVSLQFSNLYGKKAAALYTQAGDYQKTARFYYKKAEDTYYQVRIRSLHCCYAVIPVVLARKLAGLAGLVSTGLQEC